MIKNRKNSILGEIFMNILIKNGRMIDPDKKIDKIADVLISEGKIEKVGEQLESKADRVIDARGCYVMPGLIDLHVHLRDPGLTQKEDIESGAKAAAKGGFTTIVAMPNTKPVIDTASGVRYVMNKATKTSPIHVLQAGAITKGQDGKELADIKEMIQAGSPAISEDGKSVMNSQLYREAMEIAAACDIPVLAHCEDSNLVNGGCVNDDAVTRKMGLPGISNAVEDIITARDIMLAGETGCRLHLCHCSTSGSVDMMELAKKHGILVTAEVCPHHFTLTSKDIVSGDTNYKMNPPLRTTKDVESLKQGLRQDIIDVISTDHAPHTLQEKSSAMEKAPFGIVGLETCVALTISELVKPGILTPMQMAEKMSFNPARILQIDKGSLSVGKDADVVIIDPGADYVVDTDSFVSKGKNTPFNGRKVKGKVLYTICDGEVVYEE